MIIKLAGKEEVAKDTIKFEFEKPQGFEFIAGQSMDLFLINPSESDEEGNKRAFSIVAAPFEDSLAITSRMRDTAFKRVLKSLPVGSELKMEGPFGSFTLHNDEERPAVFLTGGIGITPVFSMLKQANFEKKPHRVFLFYANHTLEDTVFLDEITELSQINKNFVFVPTMTRDDPAWSGEKGRITKEMIQKYVSDLQSPIYYICGPAGMVAGMKEVLKNAQVNEDNIRSEDFTGY